jgi:hypothetical protein
VIGEYNRSRLPSSVARARRISRFVTTPICIYSIYTKKNGYSEELTTAAKQAASDNGCGPPWTVCETKNGVGASPPLATERM